MSQNPAEKPHFPGDLQENAVRPNCVVVEAVCCEPFSTENSLLTGKLTGNFVDSRPPVRFSCLIGQRIQSLAAKFPTQRNREFPDAYQGMNCEEQGI
jgi:hypothetical protein